MGGKAEALKVILTSRNLVSTERNRRNEDNGPYLEILYVLVSPPSLSYASFCPIFLTKEKAQLSRPDQNYRGSQENEINMEVGRDKGSILTCPTLCLPRICSGPTAMILMDDGYVQRHRVLSKKTC